MRRLLPAAGAVCLGVLLGLVLAPMVFSLQPDGAPGQSQAADSSGSDPAGGGQRTAVPTMPSSQADSTATPTPTPSESASPSQSSAEESAPGERVDERAGVLDRDIPDAAGGDMEVVPGEQEAPDPDAAEIVTIRLEVEAGLPIDEEAFADFVMTTLNDPRSWGSGGAISFARTDGEADIPVLLASPATTDELCAPLRTLGRYSCGHAGHVAINALRYAQATEDFLAAGSLLQYRYYVVNHEVGHLLGHGHEQCPGAGQLAPVMQQQTISLGECEPNGWPHPDQE